MLSNIKYNISIPVGGPLSLPIYMLNFSVSNWMYDKISSFKLKN